ncbi:hypothetical protein GA0070616_1357 [Micromonospora nigra]|uniref:DUF4913 domain-containing protein n=1 Tax=Micromonospora nigra TaxID=145857 RepID=A0A1C6RKT3_9ACTN|nr:hypothetical protein [Micromonospora nigra]SCL17782.1 hypothetical protein GA0070616_1357 [Micromonospora nigra]
MSGVEETLRAQMLAVVKEVQRVQASVAGLANTAATAKATAEAAQAATTRLAEELVALVRDSELGGQVDGGDVQRPVPGLSWLTVSDPDEADRLMRGFVDWLATVYCRWQSTPLPDCWAWHPPVVAELLALRDAWYSAVDRETGSAARQMDWVDRYRPGVARRIGKEMAGCSLSKHTPDRPEAYRPPRVHGAELVDALAAWWWQTGGRETAPGPSPAMLAESKARATEVE